MLLAFHGELPAFAQLGHKMGCELFGCQGQSLSLVGRNISPNEKTGGADNFGIGHEHRTAACLALCESFCMQSSVGGWPASRTDSERS